MINIMETRRIAYWLHFRQQKHYCKRPSRILSFLWLPEPWDFCESIFGHRKKIDYVSTHHYATMRNGFACSDGTDNFVIARSRLNRSIRGCKESQLPRSFQFYDVSWINFLSVPVAKSNVFVYLITIQLYLQLDASNTVHLIISIT